MTRVLEVLTTPSNIAHFRTGSNVYVCSMLKDAVQCLIKISCCLMFDEMSVRENLRYNQIWLYLRL